VVRGSPQLFQTNLSTGIVLLQTPLQSIGSFCSGVCKNDATDPDVVWGLTLVGKGEDLFSAEL